ncbi:MAG: hypothetical protein H0X24_24970 [Ktedonobacterales bacterium]|nr:hypothetical protein [Ktedonobacterales bacterium]
MNTIQQRPTLWQQAMCAGLLKLQCRLAQLDWVAPLTRADVRAQWPAFPQYAYLRLPAAKHFASAGEVVRALLQAELCEVDDLPDEWRVISYGGPPGWGVDPLIGGETQESGSATDTAAPWLAQAVSRS